MARRERTTSTAPSTDSGDSAVDTLPEEAPVSTTTEEVPVETEASVPAQSDAPAEAAPAAKAEEHPVDLTAFNEALTAAVAGRDTDSGDVPLELSEGVVTAYRALDGLKAKNAAKKAANDGIREAMNQMDIAQAKAYMTLADSLTVAPSGGGTRAERVPADPTEAFVQRVAGLQIAASLAVSNVPEGVKEGWEQLVTDLVNGSVEASTSYIAWLNREAPSEGTEDIPEPEVSDVVKAAVKLSQGKSARVGTIGRKASSGGGSTYTGERRDIGKHISEAFAGHESGTFLTVAEIRKYHSSEYEPGQASAGAISARLFPKSGKFTVEGVTPGQNADGNRGATKN